MPVSVVDAAGHRGHDPRGGGAQAEGEHDGPAHHLQGHEVVFLVVAAVVEEEAVALPRGEAVGRGGGRLVGLVTKNVQNTITNYILLSSQLSQRDFPKHQHEKKISTVPHTPAGCSPHLDVNPVSLLQSREGQESPSGEPPRPQLARGGVVQRARAVGALEASCPVATATVLLGALAAVHADAVHARAAQHVYLAILACTGRGMYHHLHSTHDYYHHLLSFSFITMQW